MTTAPQRREDIAVRAILNRTARPLALSPHNPERLWLYAADQFELATLARLVRESRAALIAVDYVDNAATVAGQSWFRLSCDNTPATLDLLIHGTATVFADGESIAVDVSGAVSVDLPHGCRAVDVRVNALPGEPASIGVTPDGGSAWLASLDGQDWRRAGVRGGGIAAPHSLGEPIRQLPLAAVGGHYELAAPVLARVVIESATRPLLRTGESLAEALSDEGSSESRHDLDERTPGVWVSRHEHAVRFVVVRGSQIGSVTAEARVRRVVDEGAFVSSDATLNRIWAVGVATLHTCMQTLIVDGIKRDRLPWQGDLAVTLLANAYSIADAQIVRDTLVALGRSRVGYVNGIADYSLWWLVSVRSYLAHCGADEYLREQRPAIAHFVETLIADTDPDGLLRPRDSQPAFAGAGPEGVFLDWGAPKLGSESTAFQLLWLWALRSAGEVLTVLSDPAASIILDRAEHLERVLVSRGWNDTLGRWMSRLDDSADPAPAHPNLVAVMAGVGPVAATDTIAEAIRTGAPGTPFMLSFALGALHRLGETDEALEQLRHLWGAQVESGALTFAEDFTGDTTTAMYGRPFGRSLCHGWSTGPVALLPQFVLGIVPLADGWSEFAVDDRLADLDWAAANVPTPHGTISVIAERQLLRVWVPAGSTLVLDGKRVTGPAAVEHVRWPAPPVFPVTDLAKESQ